MKKLMTIVALCLAGIAFAQEPDAVASATPPADKPAVEAPKPPANRDFRQRGMRGPQRPAPKFKKCECCPDCKGIIILPPNATEGEPLFKAFGEGPRGPRGEFKGPRGPRGERPQFKGPRGPRPDAPKPDCACGAACACGKGPACDCPKPACACGAACACGKGPACDCPKPEAAPAE